MSKRLKEHASVRRVSSRAKVALDEVNDTLERMARFDTVGFEVIARFA